MNGHLRAPHVRVRMIGPQLEPKPRAKAFVFTARQLEIAVAVRDMQLETILREGS